MISPLAFAAGGLTWSLAEYCLHRFVGHGPKRKKNQRWYEVATPAGFASEFYREHTAHHVDPTYFAPTGRKLLAVSVVGVASGAVASAVAGPRLGVSFALGFAGTYAGYELLHRRVHTHAPTGPYSRWMRRHHWFHHRSPRSNHGVTSPLWDQLLSTHAAPDKVRLTRAIAPAWMLDDTGDIRAHYRDDFELVSPARHATE
jgi:hypothetical protein